MQGEKPLNKSVIKKGLTKKEIGNPLVEKLPESERILSKKGKTKSKAKSSMIEQQRTKATTSGKPPVYDIIGNRLRDYYDEVAKQPVPDRFMELLMQLEAKTEKKD